MTRWLSGNTVFQWRRICIFGVRKRPNFLLISRNIIQLLPLCEGNMTVCSPEAGNIARGRSPRAILPVEGEQVVTLPSHKGNNCFIMPINICVCNVKK